MNEQEARDEGGVRTLTSFPRILEVLYALTTGSATQGVRTIAQLTGNSRSATQRILRSLAEAGYAEQGNGGSYAVGPRLVQLSARALWASRMVQLAGAAMSELVEALGETCHLAIYTEGDTFTTFVHRIETDHPIRHVQQLGQRLPLHAGAVGKAILSRASISLDQLELTAYTPQTITSTVALGREMEEARLRGFAVSKEERVAGVVGVASPVIQWERVVGGLTVSIPASRSPKSGLDAIGDLVARRAQVLSAALTKLNVRRN